MPPISVYDISAHTLLSSAAADLGADDLDAWTATAEHVLCLSGTDYTLDAVVGPQVLIALAHAVNSLLASNPSGLAIGEVASESKEDHSVTFATSAGRLKKDGIPNFVWAMVDKILARDRPHELPYSVSGPGKFAWRTP